MAAQRLTFNLAPGAPYQCSINPTNGILTWRPAEANGPGTYQIGVIVTDDGSPRLRATNVLQVTVLEVNSPPQIGIPGLVTDQT